MEKENYEKTVVRVGIVTIVWNILLSLAKILVGIIAGSYSLVSDGFHSASDVFTTVIVMIGAKVGKKAADEKHPFGHERFESVANIILVTLLFVTALSIGYAGIEKIEEFTNGTITELDSKFALVALLCAVASIVIKGWMFFYTLRAAKKINSTGLKADAYHHLSDSLSSIGSMLGTAGLMIGGAWGILDPIASIVIALFIIKVGVDIFKEAVSQLVDTTAPKEFDDFVKSVIAEHKNILSVDSIKTRQFGNMYYVEIEIGVNGKLTVEKGHEIAQELHDDLESKNDKIKHCMVHVNPVEEK